MATNLKRLRIDRVDFVDAGANPHARITLAKRATALKESPMELPEDVAKRITEQDEAIAALTKRADAAETKQKETEAFQKAAEDKLAEEVSKREGIEAEAVAKALVLPGIEDKPAFVQKVKRAMGNDWPALESVLKALAIADRTSEVFKELGSDAKDGPKEGHDRINEIADSLVAKGDFKTRVAALPAAFKTPEGKAAYADHLAGMRKGRA